MFHIDVKIVKHSNCVETWGTDVNSNEFSRVSRVWDGKINEIFLGYLISCGGCPRPAAALSAPITRVILGMFLHVVMSGPDSAAAAGTLHRLKG